MRGPGPELHPGPLPSAHGEAAAPQISGPALPGVATRGRPRGTVTVMATCWSPVTGTEAAGGGAAKPFRVLLGWGRQLEPAARGCSLAHPHTGLGPAGQVTGDSIPAPLQLLMGKARFSQRKDRNRSSSGELGANQKNSENLFSSGADSRLPALGQPPAGAGGQGAEPLPARLTADVPRRGRAARRAFIWARPSPGCVGLSTVGFQEFPSGGKPVLPGNS